MAEASGWRNGVRGRLLRWIILRFGGFPPIWAMLPVLILRRDGKTNFLNMRNALCPVLRMVDREYEYTLLFKRWGNLPG